MSIPAWEMATAAGIAALDLIAVATAIWRSQGVERTLAWLFAILALPGIGALVFFLLADPRVRRTTARKRRAAAEVRGAHPEKGCPIAPVNEGRLLRLAAATTDLPPTCGNAVELLAESDQAFERIEEAVRSARASVWAEYYLIRRDETGHRFLDLLVDRARAGMEVRLLYDAVGSLGLDRHRLEAIVAAGGRAEAFHPLNPFRRRWSLHLRNHRKLVLIDGRLGFTGGMNVGDEYSGRARRRGMLYFRDSHLSLAGPAVADLAQVFIEDWAFATDETLALPDAPAVESGSSVVAVLPSGPDQERNASALAYFGALAEARERAWLTSPYFIPDEPTLRALQSAALGGVDVRLLVPARSDVALLTPASRSYFPALLRSGVRVFEYLPSMLHAKTMAVDGRWCIVGSANLDIRSFRLNFELSALVEDTELAGRLEARFREDLTQSRELDAGRLAARPVWAKARERAARLLSPLL